MGAGEGGGGGPSEQSRRCEKRGVPVGEVPPCETIAGRWWQQLMTLFLSCLHDKWRAARPVGQREGGDVNDCALFRIAVHSGSTKWQRRVTV